MGITLKKPLDKKALRMKELADKKFARIVQKGFEDQLVVRVDPMRVVNLTLCCVWDRTLLGQNIDEFLIEPLEPGTVVEIEEMPF